MVWANGARAEWLLHRVRLERRMEGGSQAIDAGWMVFELKWSFFWA